ncbi:MAG: hypothetical protein ABJA78_10050 [Ferruginibacter sp.]
MKTKIYLLAAILFITVFSANAQIEKGTHLLGGSFYLSNYNSDVPSNADKSTGFGTTVSIGCATKTNRITSFLLGYSYNNSVNSGTQNYFSVGVSRTRYFELAKDFYITGAGALTFTYDMIKNPGITMQKVTGYSVAADLNAGLAYQVNKRVLVNLSILHLLNASYGYSQAKATVGSVTTTTTGNLFNVNGGLAGNSLGQIGIGFNILFHKH